MVVQFFLLGADQGGGGAGVVVGCGGGGAAAAAVAVVNNGRLLTRHRHSLGGVGTGRIGRKGRISARRGLIDGGHVLLPLIGGQTILVHVLMDLLPFMH